MSIKINNKPTLKSPAKSKAKKTKKVTAVKRHITLTASAYKPKSKKSKGYTFKFLFRFISLIFIVAIFASGFVLLKEYLYTYEKFFIDEIEIDGCENITKSEIIKILPFQVGESLLKIEVSDAKKNLEKNKQELKDISISRKWFDKKVVISFKERVPEVFINIKDKKMGLDFDNKPFDLAGNMSYVAVPTIIFKNDKERNILLTFFKNAKEYINDLIPRITEIKYGDIDDINLTLDDNINIYWGLPKENKIEDKSYKLQKILDDLEKRKTAVQSIDLSFIDENKDMVTVKVKKAVEHNS